MKRLELVVPRLVDYWYEKRCFEDPGTMSYNAEYDGIDTKLILFSKREEVYNENNNL